MLNFFPFEPLIGRFRIFFNLSINFLFRTMYRHFRQGAASPRLKSIAVLGLLRRASGIARAGRLTALGLRSQADLIVEVDVENCFGSSVFKKSAIKDRNRIVLCDTIIIHCNPLEAERVILDLGIPLFNGRYVIGYWAFELPDIPDSWIRRAVYFDEIWVPSRFVFNAVTAKIKSACVRVVPHPVLADPYLRSLSEASRNKSVIKKLEYVENSSVSVLAMLDSFSSADRKNLTGIVESFEHAFQRCQIHGLETECKFFIKVLRMTESRIRTLIKDLHFKCPINFITDELTDSETIDLINDADLIVSLHRSEGFGLHLAESFVLGKMIVSTIYSGEKDFLCGAGIFSVPYTLVPVQDSFGIYDDNASVWAQPDTKIAGDLIASNIFRIVRENGIINFSSSRDVSSKFWSKISIF